MVTRIRNLIALLFYSFPLQLFLVLVKKNQFLLFYWILIIACVTGNIGTKFGIPYLFLDPEYLGSVDFRSLYIMGLTCGGFVMSFTISSYILNGFRFPFMAALSRPFHKYFFNSLPIPMLFIGIYMYRFCNFQYYNEFQPGSVILAEVISFLLGTSTTVLLTLTYFFGTDKDIFKVTPNAAQAADSKHYQRAGHPKLDHPHVHPRKKAKAHKEWRVDSYLIHFFRARLTRGTDHYDRATLALISKRNHVNAAMMELIVFILIISLGLFRDYSYFRIPAAASILLLLSLVMMLTSAYRFWMKGWAMTLAIGLVILFNALSQNNYFNRRNQAYGLNYSKTQEYSLSVLKSLSTPESFTEDSLHTISILEKWKTKNIRFIDGKSSDKPKMVFVCSSGGGLRSAVWSMRVMQVLDSVTQGKLITSTQLMTGASGGAIGAAYFRELYLKQLRDVKKSEQNRQRELHSDHHLDQIARDMLNPIAISIAVNDIFLGFQSFTKDGIRYKKDRAFEFEMQLNENTDSAFTKKLRDYKKPEEQALIPMMVCYPTIVNDGRRLFISPQPMSYLTSKNPLESTSFKPLIEGVEFGRLFKDADALNVNYSSVLRMNATFPYVMPTVSLPSNPPIQLMDAGMRDNFGIQTAIRFLYVFRDWISNNTDGVLIIQIRDTQKEAEIENKGPISLLNSLTTPLETFYNNFAKVQDYNQDELMQYAGSWFKGNITELCFQLPEGKDKASLSWHLTTREKKMIYHAIDLENNRVAIERVKTLLN